MLFGIGVRTEETALDTLDHKEQQLTAAKADVCVLPRVQPRRRVPRQLSAVAPHLALAEVRVPALPEQEERVVAVWAEVNARGHGVGCGGAEQRRALLSHPVRLCEPGRVVVAEPHLCCQRLWAVPDHHRRASRDGSVHVAQDGLCVELVA